MDYSKIYNQLVERAKNRILSGYVEKHHVIPRCMGGLDVPENIVELTAREHYLCHRLLTRMYPKNKKLVYAFWAMTNQASSRQLRDYYSSRAYSEAKEMFSAAHSNRVISDETRQKLSAARKGKKSPKSAEFVEKLLEGGQNTRFKKGQTSLRKGQKLSAETIEKRTNSRKGYKTSDETKQKISATSKGKPKPPRDDEWRRKQTAAKKGVPRKDVFVCEKCNKTIGGSGNYKKHQNSCKSD